jgi:hypothetical protein
MSERALRIVNKLVRITTPGAPSNFRQLDESIFELETEFTAAGRKTFLHFDSTADAFLVYFTHVFGYLDKGAGVNVGSLLAILSENKQSVQYTGMYFAVESQKNALFVSLNASHQYLFKWSDDDIAEAVYLQLCLLSANFMFDPPEPIRIFGEQY